MTDETTAAETPPEPAVGPELVSVSAPEPKPVPSPEPAPVPSPEPSSQPAAGPEPPRPKRSLILAGGGYKVAFQAGVLQVWLDEAGLEFDHADGASGGNLNLAMWCQGMSGRQIADNWRSTRPVEGIAFNWRSWWKLIWADSLLTLDRFRSNVLRNWGIDFARIRSTEKVATFNVYDFTTHELVPLPPSKLDQDFLMASISIPGWFPPVRIGDHTYLDAVFLSDANLEEAIARGSDELWVIWTVGERSEWYTGFIGIYFGIIEVVANGNFRRVIKRIERNNAAIAAGQPGEFGRHITLRIIRAEVPIPYLVVMSGDRVRECVERGVAAARVWCAEQGIPLRDPGTAPGAEDHTRLRFTEEMKGFVARDQTDYQAGYAAGEAAGERLMVHLTITLEGVRRFIGDPGREGTAEGWVEWSGLPGRVPVDRGTFNLFTDDGDPRLKWMRYRLFIRDADDQPLTVAGFKRVKDDPGFDVWDDTSTLFTHVYRGHVELDQEPEEEILAAGIIRVFLMDFLHQLTTFEVEGVSRPEQLAVLAEFGSFFMGRLWDVYAKQVLTYSPV